MSNVAKSAQKKIIDEKMQELLLWYLGNARGGCPTHIAKDEKTYRGLVLRWFEPKLQGIENVILIEEALGDSWTLRFEPETVEIKVFT